MNQKLSNMLKCSFFQRFFWFRQSRVYQEDLKKGTKGFSEKRNILTLIGISIKIMIDLIIFSGSILLFGPRTPHYKEKLTLKAHTKAISCLAFSPKGDCIASSGDDQLVFLWDFTLSIKHRTIKEFSTYITSISFSPDNKLIAIASDSDEITVPNTTSGALNSYVFKEGGRKVKVFEVSTCKTVSELCGHLGSVQCLAFHPKGECLVTGCGRNLKIWDCCSWKEKNSIEGCADTLAFSPDGNLLAYGGASGQIHLLNSKKWKKLFTLEGHSECVRCLQFSPDGKFLISGDSDGVVLVWDLNNKAVSRRINCDGQIVCLSISSDGRNLATGGLVDGIILNPFRKGQVKLWDLTEGKLKAILGGHKKGALGLAFSPNGENLITGDGEGNIKKWIIKGL